MPPPQHRTSVPLVARVHDALRAAPDATATLADLWRRTRIERRQILGVLSDLHSKGLVDPLDPPHQAGAWRDLSDSDTRRWQLTPAGRQP